MFESRHLVSYKGSLEFFRLNRVDAAGSDAVSGFASRMNDEQSVSILRTTQD